MARNNRNGDAFMIVKILVLRRMLLNNWHDWLMRGAGRQEKGYQRQTKAFLGTRHNLPSFEVRVFLTL
jgi:hypothetical protein